MSYQSNKVEQVIGRVATDSNYRSRFFNDADEALAGYELNPVERETLHRMANCAVTRMGTAMLNKTHSKHKAGARKTVAAV